MGRVCVDRPAKNKRKEEKNTSDDGGNDREHGDARYDLIYGQWPYVVRRDDGPTRRRLRLVGTGFW